MSISHTLYSKITSIGNLLQAWDEFKKGKRNRKDVQIFERSLEDNLFDLHQKLKKKTYQHATYIAFNIYDPKFRHIHKAIVGDRIVHHAIISVIEPIFDKLFMYDSYSCRKNKGIHRAVKRLSSFIRIVSRNYTENCFALKLDIRKFFESVNHEILLTLLKRKIKDNDLLWLLKNILQSFSEGKGIPIGNLTSQIFANIYLNELDQFIKHGLRIKYHIRYTDDFVILSKNLDYLKKLISQIELFLREKLKLSLHENKIIICKYTQGVDFLGYIVLPHYILPRTKTKRRILKKIKDKLIEFNGGNISEYSFNQTIQSYLGFLKHADSHKLTAEIKRKIKKFT